MKIIIFCETCYAFYKNLTIKSCSNCGSYMVAEYEIYRQDKKADDEQKTKKDQEAYSEF